MALQGFVTPTFRNHRAGMLRFAPVPDRHESIIVLASGPSGSGPWPRHPGVPVIAVNGAIEGLSWSPDYWFTLDPSPVNQVRIQNRRAGTKYYVAVEPDYGPQASDMRFRANFTDCHLLCRKRNLPGLSDDPRVINMGNSGRAAIQLAMHMGAKRIAVFGVDGTDDPHWYDPGVTSGNLNHLGKSCALLKREGVELVFADVGNSKVQGQTKMRPRDVISWITRTRE